MQVLGYIVRLFLDPLRPVLRNTRRALHPLLGPSELEAIARYATFKRRVEFVGGRIAAKLAFCAAAGQEAMSCSSLAELDIPPTLAGLPLIYHRGCPMGTASISHSGNWAAGFFPVCGTGAVDVEDDMWSGRPIQDYFSCFELIQIKDSEDARIRWTLKEAYEKLAGAGILDRFSHMLTFFFAEQMWVAILDHSRPAPSAMLGTFKWGTLVVAVAIAPTDRTAMAHKPDLRALGVLESLGEEEGRTF